VGNSRHVDAEEQNGRGDNSAKRDLKKRNYRFWVGLGEEQGHRQDLRGQQGDEEIRGHRLQTPQYTRSAAYIHPK
jgi:hypothetical protein